MDSYKKDYNKLYLLQDKFLTWFRLFQLPFYLTGGTALGRFYLNHRYSEDLDFFVNADQYFTRYIDKIKSEITNHFNPFCSYTEEKDCFSMNWFFSSSDLCTTDFRFIKGAYLYFSAS
jgi:predicted nucleotidyltransferase component of viral defense system